MKKAYYFAVLLKNPLKNIFHNLNHKKPSVILFILLE